MVVVLGGVICCAGPEQIPAERLHMQQQLTGSARVQRANAALAHMSLSLMQLEFVF